MKQPGYLDSWKQIADFLKRGARTVQRWERTEGMPVHRHHHLQRGTVYAFEHELAQWIGDRRNRLESTTALESEFTAP